ncbi:hypothetical protein ACLIBH_04930 [Virgibacillus sp. W0430]|uniref:hypothetical protein n=1 Tax=Virgibacillus sp. W0430 TaxID=3391580 RepID=UPI003F45EA6C
MQRDIQKHVKNNCATYAGNGRCLLDKPCPFFDAENEGARCSYFENNVIPSDDNLTAKYWARFGAAYWNDGDTYKPCNKCGNNFDYGKSPKRQYCDRCRNEQARENRNKRMRKYRRNKQAE